MLLRSSSMRTPEGSGAPSPTAIGQLSARSFTMRRTPSPAGTPSGTSGAARPVPSPRQQLAPPQTDRRPSLATAAFLMAQSNKSFLTNQQSNISQMGDTNQELADFVGDELFKTSFDDFRMARFAHKLNPMAKKAVGKFLRGKAKAGASGRTPTSSPPPSTPATPAGQDDRPNDCRFKPGVFATLGTSAILELARKKRHTQADRSGRLSKCSRAARVRQLRQKIAADAAAEQEQQAAIALTPLSVRATQHSIRRLQPRPDKHDLPELSAQSPMHKYSQQRPSAPVRPPKPRSLPVLQTAAARAHSSSPTPPQQAGMMVVTGPVDYNALLREQKEMFEDLGRKEETYQRMVNTYDTIQMFAHRKLSLLLKQESIFLPSGCMADPGDMPTVIGPPKPKSTMDSVVPLQTCTTQRTTPETKPGRLPALPRSAAVPGSPTSPVGDGERRASTQLPDEQVEAPSLLPPL
eukprot:TRINITY_DN5061_c0_g1_i1.p1 TRINITY_DN5061_c0_g1~~TRINITY_DN5061_c0_g1_i1.p1  ORF type:complete len:499 (+),score=130.55 TRINITY_DN5061_c0_g1_i1:108-1499(+)